MAYYGEIVKYASDGGAKAIAFDIFFTEPDSLSSEIVNYYTDDISNKLSLERAKIHIENAIDLAVENQLYNFLIEIYLTFGKLHQEVANTNEQKQDACNCAGTLYIKALKIAQKINNQVFITKVEKALSDLTTYCKFSNVLLEDKN